MISQTKNRVQAIKSRFENLNTESDILLLRKKNNIEENQLCQQKCDQTNSCYKNESKPTETDDKENENNIYSDFPDDNDRNTAFESDTREEWIPKPNSSYLYNKSEVKRSVSDSKKSLTRQTSDPGRKLQRSHAFRCDRSQKINQSPKRHGSCYGRSETGDFTLKMGEKKLSKDRLKRLGNLLEDQMRKENFVPMKKDNEEFVGVVQEVAMSYNSIPDSEVPKHILDQYAKVFKQKKNDEKQDAMTDSGVSSETENLEDEKSSRLRKLKSQFEKCSETLEDMSNLKSMNDLAASSETMRLERKNPHLILTDTLKKALKQPLPPGPPPKKPPRTFTVSPIRESPEKREKDTRQKLEKLQQVLKKRESQNQSKNIYDVAETDLSVQKPKEIHYLCTEILDITHRTLLPNQSNRDSVKNCLNSLNCAIISNSTMSLPYTRLSNSDNNRNSINFCCSCSNDSLNNFKSHMSTFSGEQTEEKCLKCQVNSVKCNQFKCHLNCKCQTNNSKFYVENENIYDVPFAGEVCESKNLNQNDCTKRYGTLIKVKRSQSKSLEDLRMDKSENEDQKIYDIPCDISPPTTPEPDFRTSSPKSNFEKLRENFENGFRDTENKTLASQRSILKNSISSKPAPLTPKPALVNTKIKVSKSSENLLEDFKKAKRTVEKKFATDTKRYRKSDKCEGSLRFSLPKNRNLQLDVDRENLSQLMNEIYETVTAVCNMDENKPGSFPTEHSDGNTSEDSAKLTRSLTEKRKNYVRRVSSRVAYLDTKNIKTTRFRHQTSICSYKSEVIDNPYSTFRSWKSFRASQNNLSKENKMASDAKTSLDRRDSTDSKFNLTDSRGNILSMKNDFSVSTDSMDDLSIDGKTGCVDIELPFEPRDRGLFNVCLLVGLNYMTGQAYVKSVFPNQVQVPPHIESLIFPETLNSSCRGEWAADASSAHCYSLVLTDERGERSYGYCRRVLPEGATTCLPLCYCLIGKYRAPGFYYKVLQEIESHHGSSEVDINSILQQLSETDFPNPGEEITITYKIKRDNLLINTSNRNSLNLESVLKCKTMPDTRRSGVGYDDSYVGKGLVNEGVTVDGGVLSDSSDRIPEFYDLENNNGLRRVMLSFEDERTKIIKRPIEPRVDEDNLSVLLDSLGAGLVIKVFGSLLLERKVIIVSDQLSSVSSCLEALQSALYPLVWQQPLISTVPAAIRRDVLEAPLPILAGMLKTDRDDDLSGIVFEEGMLIDLTHPSKVLYYQGDESTILPTSSYKTLKTSLQMESAKNRDRQEDGRTRNVMISEAFLRFFVDMFGGFWKYFAVGELKEGDLGKGDVVFDKDAFIKSSSSKQNQYFLEWFTETAMFNHFIQNMAACYRVRQAASSSKSAEPSNSSNSSNVDYTTVDLVDTPLPNFYELFDERVRSRNKTSAQKCVEGKNNYKNAVNKKVKLLKNKLRDLVT